MALVQDVLGIVSGWAETAGAGLSAAWTLWVGLSDAYAWTEIGAFITPVLAIVVVGVFRAITRLHLEG